MEIRSAKQEQIGKEIATDQKAGTQPQLAGAMFPSLGHETREVVPTDCAAFHLNRRPQTLRGWACLDNGPIRPVRILARLGWRTDDIRRLVSGGAK